MAAEDSPAFQFYVKEWRSSRTVQRMTFAERAMYFEMLCEQWEAITLPDDPQEVAALIATSDGQTAEIVAAWPLLRRKFATVEGQPGRIQNLRLERVRREKRAFIRGAKKGGKMRAAQAARTVAGAFISSTSRQPAGHQPVASSITSRAPADHQLETSTATASSTATAQVQERARAELNESTEVLDRARAFIERYPQIYAHERHGARYPVKEARDFPTFVTLVQTWTDDQRLDDMFRVFLHLKGRDVLNQPGSPGQFLHHAPECDQLLRSSGR